MAATPYGDPGTDSLREKVLDFFTGLGIFFVLGAIVGAGVLTALEVGSWIGIGK